jgi:hypothetical protein
MPERRTVIGLLATTTLAAGLLIPGVAAGASPAQIAPKRGSALALGSQPTFKVRDTSAAARKYNVFVTVSTSKTPSRSGDLRKTQIGTFAEMHRRGSTYSYKTPVYNFPTWFMVRAGTYYWQAFRIDCRVAPHGCHVHSKIRSFKVQ